MSWLSKQLRKSQFPLICNLYVCLSNVFRLWITVKGWLRKGHCLLMTKACSKAAEAFRRALELDDTSEEARDGLHRALSSDASDPEAARKRALDDPEVQAILGDPAMQLILQQMQGNPAALRECAHILNPLLQIFSFCFPYHSLHSALHCTSTSDGLRVLYHCEDRKL